MNLASQNAEDWRSDMVNYLYDLMNDQEVFKRAIARIQHGDHCSSLSQPEKETSHFDDITSFRERLFRDVCREIIHDQNHHGSNTISSDKTPPAWTTENYSDDKRAGLLNEWIKQKGGWQIGKAANDRLAELKKQYNTNITWGGEDCSSDQDVEFAGSLYMLEPPAIPLNTRVLPKWTLQSRARKLPIIKVPRINDMPIKQTADFIRDAQRVSIDHAVFSQLAQFDLKPYDELPIANIKVPGENGPVWSGLEANFFDNVPPQRWLSQEQQEPSLSGTAATSRKQHEDSPPASSASTAYTQQLGYDLGALLKYDDQNNDGCELPINDSITTDDDFNHTSHNDGASNNQLFIPNHDLQLQDKHSKATTKEAKTGVQRKASMYIDVLAGIRRVNEYAGKRRRLDDLIDDNTSKQCDRDIIDDMEHVFAGEEQNEGPIVAADPYDAEYKSTPDRARLSPISPSACSDSPAKTMATVQEKRFASRQSASPLTIPSAAPSPGTGRLFMPKNIYSPRPPFAARAATTTSMDVDSFASIHQFPSIHYPTPPAGKGKLVTRREQASTLSIQAQHNSNPRASSPPSTCLEHHTTAFPSRYNNINNYQQALVANTNPAPFVKTASSFEQFLTTTDSYMKKRSELITASNDGFNNSQQQQQQERSSVVHSFTTQPLVSFANSWKLAGPSINNGRGRGGGFSAGANVSDFVAMRKLAKGNGTQKQPPARPPMHHQQWQARNNRDNNNKPFCELRGPYSTMDEKYQFDEET